MNFTHKKEQAARLLAKNWGQAKTARDERVAVSKQTMNTWCKEPEFRARIEELRTDPVIQAEELLDKNVLDAAETVVEIATSIPVDEFGEPLDFRIVGHRLRAALFILGRKTGKKMPQENQKDTELEADDFEIDEILENASK